MSDSEDEKQEEMTEEEKEEAEREESNQIWQCFMQFDSDQQGMMFTTDLKQALEALGEKVSDK